MKIPVYLFTGFLDSGKTSFIRSILTDPNFFVDEHTLLLMCEDGEEEYSDDLLKKCQTNLVEIEKIGDLNRGLLDQYDEKYHPDRVVIEWNGMWKLSELPPDALPRNWEVYQTVTTVDSSTFDAYFTNMGTFMYDMLTNTDMLVFNRADGNTPQVLRDRRVRMINRRADIFLDYPDGSSEPYEEDLNLALDMSAPVLEIGDDIFGRWYFDAMENAKKYDGHTVKFLTQVYTPKGMQKGCFAAGRFMMLCCAEDINFAAMVAKGAGPVKLIDRDWYTITAEVRNEFFPEYQGEGPVLYVRSLQKAEKPEEDLIYIR